MKDQTPEMTLRDYFAAKVMAAYAASAAWNYETNLDLACSASYAYADAMLKARVNIPIQKTFLNIDALELPIRIQNCLKAENIYSIQKLIAYTESDLLKTPNLGRHALARIKHELTILNLKLKENNGTT